MPSPVSPPLEGRRMLGANTVALALLPVALAFAGEALRPAGGHALWTFRGFRWVFVAVVLALPLVARAAVFERRLPAKAEPWLVAASALPLWLLEDRSASGDFHRVLADATQGVWLLKAEPLGPSLFRLVALAADAAGAPRLAALQGVVSLWGVLGVYASVRVARACSEPNLTFALLSSGAVFLFFGHLETYTVPAVLILLHLEEVRRMQDDPARFPRALAWLSLACGFHMEMACLVPALLAVAPWRALGVRRVTGLVAGLVAAPLAALQALCAAFPPPYAQHYGGGDGVMLVAPERWFDPERLLGVANLVLLVAPAAPLVLAGAWALRWRALRHDRWNLWLVLASLSWGVFAFLWNPDLGIWRDRDLYAAGGFVWCLAAAQAVVSWVKPAERGRALALLILVQLGRAVPLVLANHRH